MNFSDNAYYWVKMNSFYQIWAEGTTNTMFYMVIRVADSGKKIRFLSHTVGYFFSENFNLYTTGSYSDFSNNRFFPAFTVR